MNYHHTFYSMLRRYSKKLRYCKEKTHRFSWSLLMIFFLQRGLIRWQLLLYVFLVRLTMQLARSFIFLSLFFFPRIFFSILLKGVLKICSKFTGGHPCRSVISIKFFRNFIEIALRHGCSPVNFQHIFRTPFYKNTYGGVLLNVSMKLLTELARIW